jgi:excinuclease ABC subunit B
MEGAYASGQAASPKRYAKVAEQTIEYGQLSSQQAQKKITKLEKQMFEHARNLEFEEAAGLRDEIKKLRQHMLELPETR